MSKLISLDEVASCCRQFFLQDGEEGDQMLLLLLVVPGSCLWCCCCSVESGLMLWSVTLALTRRSPWDFGLGLTTKVEMGSAHP